MFSCGTNVCNSGYILQPDSIRVMGDKSTARETMKKAGVPTVPGSDGLLQVSYLTLGISCFSNLQYQDIRIDFAFIVSFIFIFLQSTEEGIKLAEEIGYPVMIKVKFVVLIYLMIIRTHYTSPPLDAQSLQCTLFHVNSEYSKVEHIPNENDLISDLFAYYFSIE